MPNPANPRDDDVHRDGHTREDADVPRADDDRVLDETARMAREGRKELENDPKEKSSANIPPDLDTQEPRE